MIITRKTIYKEDKIFLGKYILLHCFVIFTVASICWMLQAVKLAN